MNLLLATGFIILVGFLFGELASKVKLPKISGYIVAGIILNPGLTMLISTDFIDDTSPLIYVALSFITFSIGGTLSKSNIRESGKIILTLTLFESIFAYLFVAVSSFIVIYYVFGLFHSWQVCLVVSLILAALAAPTDPSATLAVKNEYHAKGEVSTTVLGIAAFDDITGIILYTLSISFSRAFMGDGTMNYWQTSLELGRSIGGAILIGMMVGWLFNLSSKVFKRSTDGEQIVTITGFLLTGYGLSSFFGFDELLTTMTMGVMVVNFNPVKDRIFSVIERYTDELIFVIFFTFSGLHLELSSLTGSAMVILIYVVFRFLGKYFGIFSGSVLIKAPRKIRKFTAGGLFPQGGIVIGLALLIAKEDTFKSFSTLVIGIVIGAAVIQEIMGPIIAKIFLKKAGEIGTSIG